MCIRYRDDLPWDVYEDGTPVTGPCEFLHIRHVGNQGRIQWVFRKPFEKVLEDLDKRGW